MRGELICLIQANGVILKTFWDQVIVTIRFENIGIGKMKWFIKNDLFVVPDPGIFTCGNRQIALLCVAVVNFKEEIPCLRLLNKEGIGDEFGSHISDILRFKQGVYPALKSIEMKRGITAVNADGPLFSLGDKGNTAFHPDISAADEAEEQTDEGQE